MRERRETTQMRSSTFLLNIIITLSDTDVWHHIHIYNENEKKMGLHDTVYHYAALLLIKYVERRKINKKLSKFISISIFMRSCLCIAYHHRQFDTDTKTLWFFFFPFSSNLATIKRVKIQKYLFIRKLTFVPREIYQLLWGKTKIHLLKTGAQEEEERETDEFRVLNTRTSKFIIEK